MSWCTFFVWALQAAGQLKTGQCEKEHLTLTPMCSQLLLSLGIAVKVAGCWPVATWRCDQAMWESHALFDASKIILLASFLRLMKTEHCERRSLSEARGQSLAEWEWDRRPSQGWVSVFLLWFYYLRPLYRKRMALLKKIGLSMYQLVNLDYRESQSVNAS